MTIDSAQAFYQDLSSGKLELDPEMMRGDDHAKIMSYAHSFGYDFNEEEMLSVLADNGNTISMEEAEAIAGGSAAKGAEEAGGVVGLSVVGSAAAACA